LHAGAAAARDGGLQRNSDEGGGDQTTHFQPARVRAEPGESATARITGSDELIGHSPGARFPLRYGHADLERAGEPSRLQAMQRHPAGAIGCQNFGFQPVAKRPGDAVIGSSKTDQRPRNTLAGLVGHFHNERAGKVTARVADLTLPGDDMRFEQTGLGVEKRDVKRQEEGGGVYSTRIRTTVILSGPPAWRAA